MQALLALTVANIRSYTRDRAAVFWTLAFPLVFIVLFGLIFQGSNPRLVLGWVDNDRSTASSQLKAGFAGLSGVTLNETNDADALDQMKVGKVDGIVEIPAGYGASLAAASPNGGGAPVQLKVFTDPSRPSLAGSVY